MENIVNNFLENIDVLSPWIVYLFFFVSAILQITFPPYPGDTILIFGGYIGSTGLFGGEIPIFLSYWIGTALTSISLYELGAWKGEPFLSNKIISKYFPLSNQKRAKDWLLKYGMIMFFICKFIPGINTLVIMLGGSFHFRRIWAYIGVGVASAVHNILFLFAGRLIGDNLDRIADFLSLYNKAVIAVLALSAAAYAVYYKLRKPSHQSVPSKED